MNWDDPRLIYTVREPFASRTSGVSMTMNFIEPLTSIEIESRMPSNGVIFSDGIESDFLEMSAWKIVKIQTAKQKAKLVQRGKIEE